MFFAAGEAVLVALDARTGKEVWTTKVDENKNGYYMSLAPLVADGKVMVGASGGELGIRGFVAAYDAETGKEVVEDLHRARARRARQRDVAEGRSVEDRRRLGVGDRQLRSGDAISRSGAPATADRGWAISVPATISTPSSTIAIDVATGKIKGHFQYHPNDSWDWDEVSPPILVDYQRNGRTVKGLIDVARDGYLWFLERTDGPINFVEGKPYVKQNVFRSLDPKTGRPDVDPGSQARHRQDGRLLSVALGRQELAADRLQPEDADDLHSGQREPVRRRSIGPRRCTYAPGERFTGATDDARTSRPGADHIGEVQAWNVDTGKRVWTHTYAKSPNWGPMLATGGGLVFTRRHQRSQVPRVRRDERASCCGSSRPTPASSASRRRSRSTASSTSPCSRAGASTRARMQARLNAAVAGQITRRCRRAARSGCSR